MAHIWQMSITLEAGYVWDEARRVWCDVYARVCDVRIV